jgi:hypothetical protein
MLSTSWFISPIRKKWSSWLVVRFNEHCIQICESIAAFPKNLERNRAIFAGLVIVVLGSMWLAKINYYNELSRPILY